MLDRDSRSVKELESEIERVRCEMNKAGFVYGANSVVVLQKSQELDQLLNKYYRYMMKAAR